MSWAAPSVIALTLIVFAAASIALRKRYPVDDAPLVDAIDALLPQTQCAQCGYPGCRPYAEAVAQGDTPTNLCPPGGRDTHIALNELMGVSNDPPDQPAPLLAIIDESNCIGCALCLPPCPVDAIVGAPNMMHTVLANECTGCELCVPACPVDCISMTAAPPPRQASRRRPQPLATDAKPCIHCNRCVPVCPVDLDAHALLMIIQRGDCAPVGLEDCIECGLCDRACPSEIDLANRFAAAKNELAARRAEDAARVRLKARFTAHNKRLAQARDVEAQRRAARLQSKRSWS
jgi:RnfABCDGE-type electron transport complex B subunit